MGIQSSSRGQRRVLAIVFVFAIFPIVVAINFLRGGQDSLLPCSAHSELASLESVCVNGYSLFASYDALAENAQRDLFNPQRRLPAGVKRLHGMVDPEGQFRLEGNRSDRTEIVIDTGVGTYDRPDRWPAIGQFLFDLRRPFRNETQQKSPKDNKPSCDPTNAWTLLKLEEEPLRRCLRTVFLLEMTDTFNERTQKLFENQTIRYSDGTTGPLSLKRAENTDSDRGKVVAAVKAIDKKTRALGGYH